MAYLMSDMAAGSNAAMTMMQNMGAAPLATDVGKAQAEAVIANTEKAKLANLVAETGIKADAEVKSKVQGLIQSADYLKADPADQQRKLASLYMEAGKVEDGSKLLSSAESTFAKELANKQKAMDVQAQEVGKAYSILSAVPEDKISETFDRLPEANKKALIDQVGGQQAWDKFSNAEKKEVTKNLMLNASKKLATQQRILDQEKQEMIGESRKEVAMIRERGATARKAMGGSGSAADDRNWSRYEVRVENLRKGNERALTAINKQIEEAEAAATKSVHWYTMSDTKQETKYKELVAKRDKMQRDDLQEELDLTMEAPSFPGKERAVKRLEQAIAAFGTDQPPPLSPAKEEKKPSVTSNKYTEQNPAKPTSKEEYDKLPPNSYYMQDGVLKRKKG
jgi:hypothetical protein